MAARAEASGDGPKNSGALRIVGVVVLALAAVGIGAFRMGWLPFGGSAQEESVLAKSAEPSTSAPAEAPAATPEAAALDAPAVEPERPATTASPGRRTPARLVTSGGGRAASVSAVTQEAPRLTR